MDRIEGFRQYLGVAEEDRLNALNPPDKTPELFERFLPYAIALDVENRWAKRFAAVLAAAGAGAVASRLVSGNQMGKRSGGLHAISSAARFADHRVGLEPRPDRATAAAPSGGGSSGGGGGGGGGSGW